MALQKPGPGERGLGQWANPGPAAEHVRLQLLNPVTVTFCFSCFSFQETQRAANRVLMRTFQNLLFDYVHKAPRASAGAAATLIADKLVF